MARIKPDVQAAIDSALAAAGFVDFPDHPVHDRVDMMSENGDYVVLGSWKNEAGTIVHLEQNTAPSEPGSDTLTVYPPVLAIENAAGARVGVNIHDMEAFAAALAGN
jgi:hypothetical protein